jgi:hypothetical protein
VQVEPQVHFGGGLASAVLGPVDAVGEQFHHSFTGGLIEDASRYEVEKLLENDNVGAGWFLVHTPTDTNSH